MAKNLSFDKLAEDFVCLADNGEVLAQLLSPQVVQTILDNADLIQEIYLTDSHPNFSKYEPPSCCSNKLFLTQCRSQILHVKFVLPSDLDRLEVLLRMAFFLVDAVPSIRLSKPVRCFLLGAAAHLVLTTWRRLSPRPRRCARRQRPSLPRNSTRSAKR